jgi:hypothetical protein
MVPTPSSTATATSANTAAKPEHRHDHQGERPARGLGGFLRNIPIVGASAANEVENDRYRTDMSPDELRSAWDETRQFFRECPTCRQIVCIPDFDEPNRLLR